VDGPGNEGDPGRAGTQPDEGRIVALRGGTRLSSGPY